ncbi:MAG: hypothetical protein JXR65_04545 [Bacteroidales bacterium]|nr:hypothetical protein [Bacteroidales bacterium]
MKNKTNQVEVIHKTPKLRKNTYWEKLPDGRYYINNKDSSNPLIVSEYVVHFLELATGMNTIKQICEKAGLSVNNSNVEKIHELFYVTLYSKGVIETEESKTKKKKSYINLSFTIIPEKSVIFISKYLAFLFHRKVVIISLLFSLFVLLWSSVHFLNTRPTLTGINNFSSILVTILLILVFFLHEFGHASALYYFEEVPRKIGIGLYLFAPVLFADVTDSWKLNNKKRMVVDFGGLYFQFIISCFYLFIFFISAHNDFLIAAFFSFIIGVLNLNPFIKMDGYWLLSDFLNITDLKQKAQKETLFFIQCIFKERIQCKIQQIAFVLYYVFNLLFTIAFISYMLVWNVELFKQIPANIKTILLAILEGRYHNINIILIESLILPLVVIFLVLKVLIKLLDKSFFKPYKVKINGIKP